MDYLSLRDHVYDYLVQKINSGELNPGDRIREALLAEEMDISRTPIREALIQLASEGIIENFPRRGFRVSSLNLEKVRQIYQVLGLLDGFMASKVVHLLTEKDFDLMQKSIEKMDSLIHKGDENGYYEEQMSFHDQYLLKFDNEEMRNTYFRLRAIFIRKSYQFNSHEDMERILLKTNSEHKEILKLFRERKEDEICHYILNVHWSPILAEFDTNENK
ncbi:GntR family transcriptional regulator [Guggenheimella bovis]